MLSFLSSLTKLGAVYLSTGKPQKIVFLNAVVTAEPETGKLSSSGKDTVKRWRFIRRLQDLTV